jgi:hypothetical protein
VNDLIRFHPAKRLQRAVPDHRSAEILFFTGVRYQRMSEDARSPAPRASRAVRRQGEGGGEGDLTRRR